MKVKDLEIAKKFKKLVSKKVKVQEVKVFGSRARGDDIKDSDLDILIVVDHLDHAIEKYISDCAWEVGLTEYVIIMPIAISQDTLKNSPIRESAFIKNVYREVVTL